MPELGKTCGHAVSKPVEIHTCCTDLQPYIPNAPRKPKVSIALNFVHVRFRWGQAHYDRASSGDAEGRMFNVVLRLAF